MAFVTPQHVTSGWTDAPSYRTCEPLPHPGGVGLAAPDALRGWIVLLHGSAGPEVVMLRAWVASLGGTAIRLPQVADAMPYLARNPGARIALVFDAQASDLDDRIETCMAIRAQFPACPIILMSETFARNDFSGERMAVCDASLRSPVTQVAFKLAVPAALANNAGVRLERPRSAGPAAVPVPLAGAEPVAAPAPRRGWFGDIARSGSRGLLLGLGVVAMFMS